MASNPFKITTGATTNLTKVKNGPTNITGLVAVNTAVYAIFVKFYWFEPTASAEAPTVGTTVPQLTFEVPALGTTTGSIAVSFPNAITGAGVLWMAVTKLAADSDTTATVAGDGIITVLVD